MHVRDRRQGLRRIKAQPRRERDQDLDRVRAADFRVEAAACRNRLLSLGNLVGEAIACREAGIDEGEARDDH